MLTNSNVISIYIEHNCLEFCACQSLNRRFIQSNWLWHFQVEPMCKIYDRAEIASLSVPEAVSLVPKCSCGSCIMIIAWSHQPPLASLIFATHTVKDHSELAMQTFNLHLCTVYLLYTFQLPVGKLWGSDSNIPQGRTIPE